MSSKEQQQQPQKKRQQRKHILYGMKQRMKRHDFDRENAIGCCIAHIEQYIVNTPCTQMNSRKTLKTCRCLADASFMYDNVIKRRLACSMMWWAELSHVDKKSYFRQWAQYAAANGGGGGGGEGGRQRLGGRAAKNAQFFIPDMDHSDVPLTSRRRYTEFRKTRICRNALASLFGFSRFFVSSALSNDGQINPAEPCPPLADFRGYGDEKKHHLLDKRGDESVKRKNRLEMYHSMTDYLKRQMMQHAPINDDSCNDDNNMIYLPAHVTKRQLYNTWCLERGWKPTFKNTATGCYNSIHLYTMRDYDDDEWPEGSVYKDICTWGTFQRYWTEKFPNLATMRVIRTRREAAEGQLGSRDIAAIVEMNDVDDSLKGVVAAYDNGDNRSDDYSHVDDGCCREDTSYDDNISVGDDCFNGIVPPDSSTGADSALLPTLFCDIPM